MTVERSTYLASTILPSSLENAVPPSRPLLQRERRKDKRGRHTLQLVVELCQRDYDALDMLALVEVLLRLLVTFFEVDFDGDHLQDE